MTDSTTRLKQLPEAQSTIRIVREHLGHTKRSFAIMLGMDPSHYNKYEQGRATLGPETVDKLYVYFGKTLTIGELWQPRHIDNAGRITPQKLKALDAIFE